MNCIICNKEISWREDKEITRIYYTAGCSSCHCEFFSDTPEKDVNAYLFYFTLNGEIYQWISIRKDWQLRTTQNGTTQIRIQQPDGPFKSLLSLDDWTPPQSKEFHINFINRILKLKAFL